MDANNNEMTIIIGEFEKTIQQVIQVLSLLTVIFA
jgi:hypothetical protein